MAGDASTGGPAAGGAPGGGPISKVGFVGLGMMGAPMVRRLAAAGLRVAVHDLRPSAVQALARVEGVEPAGGLTAVGAAASVVITMLPDGAAVADAVLGPSGDTDAVAAGAAPATLVIDMSSSAPWETRTLGARLAERGHRLVDAPVSGGVPRAQTGNLAIFAGGEAADVARARPILELLGQQVFHAGALGAGHAVKALNNLLSAACFSATIEAVRIAEAWGLDPETAAELFNAGTGRNNTTENKLRQHVLSGAYDAGFTMALMAKDLGNAATLADRAGLEVPLSRHVVESWTEATATLGPSADHTEMARTLGTRPAREGAEPARGGARPAGE